MNQRYYDEYENEINKILDYKKSSIHGNVHIGKYNNSAHCGSQLNVEINININVSENTSPKALEDLDKILEKIKRIKKEY